MTERNSKSPARMYPPKMSRSQPQLATAYAPGALFTWEGGKGACMAVPQEGAALDFSGRLGRRDQIIETLEEYCQNWLARGLAIGSGRNAPFYEVQLLDACFYNPMRTGAAGVEIGLDRFEFLRPDRIGYLPGPLVYRCDVCGRVREYVSSAHQVAEPLNRTCAGASQHEARWRQLDVVYVHWSGGLEGLSPFRFSMDRNGEVRKIPRCECGAEDFTLIKQGSHFSKWRFKCSGCGADREVYQKDPFTLALLEPRIEQGVPHQVSEINMVPISYRASPTFYAQTARFIVYDADPDVVALMQPSREDDLVSKLASLHGYGGSDPTDDQLRQQLVARGRASSWAPYARTRQRELEARASGKHDLADVLAETTKDLLRGWYESGDVVREARATPDLGAQVRARAGYARRFDPIRSTIEHDALRRRKINVASESANLREPHADLCAEFGTPALEASYRNRVGVDLARAGIEDAYLVRNLDMVEFSFGYTRVSATPITIQKDRPMPVRLMGFPALPNHKRPIYVIEQLNEALYIRLRPEWITAFLIANGALPSPPVPPKSLGAPLIEQYQDFGPFLSDFAVRDEASRVRGRDISSLIFLVLHTMAHHVMHGVARFSGLELGSMSEAIFPADLAFLVHRRGMTEDLGNISSMWRDHNASFLHYLVAHRELRCGSGSLCDHRGGACPACVMIPETSCIAGNQLLSRSSLIGGRAPLWDTNQNSLVGYFEVVNQAQVASSANV